jgi:hypothetical protein
LKSKKQIAYTKKIAINKLSLEEKNSLGKRLFKIFEESFIDLNKKDVIEHIIFRHGKAKLCAFYKTNGEIVGFSSIHFSLLRIKTQYHTGLYGGTWTKLDYRGGGKATLKFVSIEVLKFKLLHPLTPLSYVTAMVSPTGYRLAARNIGVIFPRHNRSIPESSKQIVFKMIQNQGFIPTGQHPFVFKNKRTPVKHSDPEGFMKSATLANDPYVLDYISLNPHYKQGDILFVHMPYTLLNMLSIFIPPLRKLMQKRT